MPVVIGHRGACGYRPEHTLAGYELAARLGADYIEPDLVSTADGVLVARHDNEIGATTDIAEHPEFATRQTTKTVDGQRVTGWFTEDFTLAELQTLRARERIPELRPHNTRHDGLYPIPTFAEVVELALRHGVGVYPETKHPAYFRRLGLALEPALVHTLAGRGVAVFVQSFDADSLRTVRARLRVPLIRLLAAGEAPDEHELARIAAYADGIGPDKSLVVPRTGDGSLARPTSLVADAHAAGLLVHPYTFRTENAFLPADFRIGTRQGGYGDAAAEYALYYGLGVDGVFSDHPDAAVAARADPGDPGVNGHAAARCAAGVATMAGMSDPVGTEGDPPPRLAHDGLVQAQQETLRTGKRRYRVDSRVLFALLDAVYGRQRTLSKFKVLEIVARVPYQVWEQVAYVAITHVHRRTGMASRIHERVLEARSQQDNEQWHLFILEELIARSPVNESRLKYFWLPQALAFGYYQLAWLLYVIHPEWSYRLNADFEDHAEHEYMAFVAEHPEWEAEPFDPDLAVEYGQFDSLADVFRQIGHDERVHKQESLAQMRQPRFR